MIKFYMIFPFLFLYSIISFSQDYLDNIIFSASAGGWSTHTYERDIEGEHISNFNYRFNLSAGYFFRERSSIGFYSGYSLRKNSQYHDTLTSRLVEREFYIGPYYKTYIKIFNRFNFTIFTSAYYKDYLVKRHSESFYPYTQKSYNLTFVPGLSYDITEKLSVDLDIGEFTAFIFTQRRDDPTLDEENKQTTLFRTYTSLNNFRISTMVFGFSYKIAYR